MLRFIIGTVILTVISTPLAGCAPNPVTHQSSMAAFFDGVGRSGGSLSAGIGAAMDNSEGLTPPPQMATAAPVQLMAPPPIITPPSPPQVVTTNCRTVGNQTQCQSF